MFGFRGATHWFPTKLRTGRFSQEVLKTKLGFRSDSHKRHLGRLCSPHSGRLSFRALLPLWLWQLCRMKRYWEPECCNWGLHLQSPSLGGGPAPTALGACIYGVHFISSVNPEILHSLFGGMNMLEGIQVVQTLSLVWESGVHPFTLLKGGFFFLKPWKHTKCIWVKRLLVPRGNLADKRCPSESEQTPQPGFLPPIGWWMFYEFLGMPLVTLSRQWWGPIPTTSASSPGRERGRKTLTGAKWWCFALDLTPKDLNLLLKCFGSSGPCHLSLVP